jgi:hypothetical protein
MTTVYIVSQVYRSRIIIGDIRVFSDKAAATAYKIKMERKEPSYHWTIWESLMDSETFITHAVK